MKIEKITNVTVTDLPGDITVELSDGRVVVRQYPDAINLGTDEVAELIKALQEVIGEAPAVSDGPFTITDNDGDTWIRRDDGQFRCRSMVRTLAEIVDTYGISSES